MQFLVLSTMDPSMTTLIKTVSVSELPIDWQVELGLGESDIVRVEIQEVRRNEAIETDAERRTRLLRSLHEIVPVIISGNSTEFIRSECDRIDGRGPIKQ